MTKDNKRSAKERNDRRCGCGHMINRSHTIDMKKTMKSKNVHGHCNCKDCNCKEISIDD